jgi:VWFA-related protein
MRSTVGGAVCAGSIAVALATALLAADPPEKPSDVGLVERATKRLVQLDVTIAGPKDAIAGLSGAEFEVRINHKRVSNVIVDDLCVSQPSAREETPPEVAVDAQALGNDSAEKPRAAMATYLLYFDMPHLTLSGRQDSIAAAREMLPLLLAGGKRAMIVANAAQLQTVVPLTSDVAQLDVALAKMVDDMDMFDPYAATEEARRAAVSNLEMARLYAAEERLRQEQDLGRLWMVLRRFAAFDPPKIVLYFADTMRQNAGEHYLALCPPKKGSWQAHAIRADADTGALPLDRVISEAAVRGIRFYTVEGQGMTSEVAGVVGCLGCPDDAYTRHRMDAQGTLVSLAAETGGRAFVNGVTPARMADQILVDLSCLYLLSFDPRGFRQDAPLTVSVRVKRPKVKALVRGRIVIQSDAKRLAG